MKKFKHEDLSNNEVFAMVFNSFYNDIHNWGDKHYGDNFHERVFYESVSLILNQLFLIKNKKTSVIQLKNDFLKLKNESITGRVVFENMKEKTLSHNAYSGKFVYYSVLNYHLFLRVFYKEVEDNQEYIQRIKSFLEENFRELEKNPIHSVVIRSVSKLFRDSNYTPQDISDYTNLLFNELKSHYAFEKESNEAALTDIEEEELTTAGNKIMLMKELGLIDFLIEKYELKNNPSQVSKIINAYTGLKFSTVNGIINPIFNSSNNQKNNPYHYRENVLKVEAKLVKLGLKK